MLGLRVEIPLGQFVGQDGPSLSADEFYSSRQPGGNGQRRVGVKWAASDLEHNLKRITRLKFSDNLAGLDEEASEFSKNGFKNRRLYFN